MESYHKPQREYSEEDIAYYRRVLRAEKRLQVPMEIGHITGRLLIQGPTVWTTKDWKLFVKEGLISEMVIAFEGGGCLFYDGVQPLSVFLLLTNGFNLYTARAVCDLLFRIFDQRPLLSSPPVPSPSSKPKSKKRNPTSRKRKSKVETIELTPV